VADLLVDLAPTPTGTVLRNSLAVAGRTGTLELRMRGTRAAGNCQGKTGTLTGVSNLVGYCQAADGHTLAFAIFTDGIATQAAHTFQDNMTITIADY
jgi:serine-type D-Ala-D-Ala carboxypeptidase/endopeptidase (penicillin-binding protein 4)